MGQRLLVSVFLVNDMVHSSISVELD